jgi:hypothetical protein
MTMRRQGRPPRVTRWLPSLPSMVAMSNRDTSTDTIGVVGAAEQLRTRANELEGRLRFAASGVPPHHTAHAGAKALKPVAAVLAALMLLMVPPAFITVRRWYWWWR